MAQATTTRTDGIKAMREAVRRMLGDLDTKRAEINEAQAAIANLREVASEGARSLWAELLAVAAQQSAAALARGEG